jgi:hypothetical protein
VCSRPCALRGIFATFQAINGSLKTSVNACPRLTLFDGDSAGTACHLCRNLGQISGRNQFTYAAFPAGGSPPTEGTLSPRSIPDPLSSSASSRGEAPAHDGPVPGRTTPSARPVPPPDASQSTALTLEVPGAGLASYGPPEGAGYSGNPRGRGARPSEVECAKARCDASSPGAGAGV